MLPTAGSTMAHATLPAFCSNAARTRVEIVEWHGQRVLGEVGGHAGAVGHAEGHGTGAGLHQEAVGVAVVAAGEFEDAVTPSENRAPGGWRSSSPRCRN